MSCKCNYELCELHSGTGCAEVPVPCPAIPTQFLPPKYSNEPDSEYLKEYYSIHNNNEYWHGTSESKASLSETFKDSKSSYVKIAACALDATNKYKELRAKTLALVDYSEGLEKFIESILTEEGWRRFSDPTDEFGSGANLNEFKELVRVLKA